MPHYESSVVTSLNVTIYYPPLFMVYKSKIKVNLRYVITVNTLSQTTHGGRSTPLLDGGHSDPVHTLGVAITREVFGKHSPVKYIPPGWCRI